ncbi:MAG: hypothetical protein IPN95_11835 [Bacteroidetes bacterium]|nr:hypothetical protein [Bacteroidota bacterium]MBP6722003.1 hypothetical protein [Bacteroidia bacterium]
MPIPNSTAVLVLGIVSIVGCFCYGVLGIICAVIALVLYGKANSEYVNNPSNYSAGSYKNLNAGRICAFVGLGLSIAYIIFLIVYVAIMGATLASSGALYR